MENSRVARQAKGQECQKEASTVAFERVASRIREVQAFVRPFLSDLSKHCERGENSLEWLSKAGSADTYNGRLSMQARRILCYIADAVRCCLQAF